MRDNTQWVLINEQQGYCVSGSAGDCSVKWNCRTVTVNVTPNSLQKGRVMVGC